ncbi:MAG TPA: glycosyltransferase, partial [Ferruginibacter sp.]|nr:glycosyltransferase [Ferruginibacter sp.]
KACFAPYDKKEAQNFIKDKYGIDKFILFVSRFEPRKNHTMLLKAWIDLKLYDKGYWLVLLGNKCQRIREFDQVLESLPDNIRSFIYIDGRSDNETLIQFYRAAAVFVYPSKGEGFGLPPLEAAAARTPVLCSNTSAMSDFVFFLKNHIDPANVDLFRSGLSKILDADPDSDQLNKISDFISYTYSPAKAADSLLRLIKEDAASTGKN